MADVNFKNLDERALDWAKYSVISRTYPPSFSHSERKAHGGIKPPELMYELITAYGKQSNNILDPFVGVGSTLIASSLLKKQATGIEINEIWKDVYLKVCHDNNIKTQTWITGDSSKVLKNIYDDTFDFLLTDVPYFSMDKLKQTRGRFSRAGESSKDKLKTSLKLFNDKPIPTKDEWKKLMFDVFKLGFKVLKPHSKLVVFIGNMYRNTRVQNKEKKSIGRYHLLSYEMAEILLKIGFKQLDELVWMDTGKKLGIYGYPYTWIPSLVDQRVLIFEK